MNWLAAHSVVFDRCYVTQPVCTPSRASLMTGLWPDAKVLPELFGDPGYHAAYMGKWHLGDELFAQHGFAEWVATEDEYRKYQAPSCDPNVRSGYHHFSIANGYHPEAGNAFSRRLSTRLAIQHSRPAFLAQEASRFLLEHRREPWMLFVNFLERTPLQQRAQRFARPARRTAPAQSPWYPRDRRTRLVSSTAPVCSGIPGVRPLR